MKTLESLGLTTFVDELDDGSQLHRPNPAIEVGVLSDEVLEAIAELGEDYRAHPGYESEGVGLGLSFRNRDSLRYIPPLDYALRNVPMNPAGHKVLSAFANQMFYDLREDQIPSYVRILILGPKAKIDRDIPQIWHTDALVPRGAKSYAEMTANLPGSKRLITGMILDGEDDEAGNTAWISGDLIIPNPVVLTDPIDQYSDIFWSEPLDQARVTRDGSSIVRLALSEQPDASLVKQFPDGVIAEIDTTTVHKGVVGATALRISLQCYITEE